MKQTANHLSNYSGCGCGRRPPDTLSSCGQPTRDGLPTWVMGGVLTTSRLKQFFFNTKFDTWPRLDGGLFECLNDLYGSTWGGGDS
jgi:hypothetical protein